MSCANTKDNRSCRTVHLCNRTPGGMVGGPGTFANLLHHNLNKTQFTMVSQSLQGLAQVCYFTPSVTPAPPDVPEKAKTSHCSLLQLLSLPGASRPEDGHASISLPQPQRLGGRVFLKHSLLSQKTAHPTPVSLSLYSIGFLSWFSWQLC